ncbi:MAG: sulfite exporter TauE/SafE family protein [Pseudomonadota bacterium]
MIDTAVLTVTLGSFAAAFVNAAFATGGVYIMLFSSVSVLPVAAAVQLQSAFAAASLMSRVYFFWRNVNWRLVASFGLGGVLGVVLGARTFVALPEAAIVTLLGFILLILIWMPALNWSFGVKHPFVFVGIIHSYLGTLFGVGGVLQPLILRTKLNKLEITGTLAACLLTLDIMKMTGYVSLGFRYLDYLPHIIGATLAGFAGTWAGKQVTHKVSEQLFRRVFRALVTLLALRLIYKGFSSG